MEALIQELANMLEVGFNEAKAMYPILREQFMYYKAFDLLAIVFGGMAIASGIAVFTSALVAFIWEYDDEYKPRIFNMIKYSLIVAIPSLILYIISNVLMYILATDLMMIKEFI